MLTYARASSVIKCSVLLSLGIIALPSPVRADRKQPTPPPVAAILLTGDPLKKESITITPSPDNSAYSVIFNNLVFETKAGNPIGTSVRTVAFKFPVSVSPSATLIGYRTDVRFHITKSKDVRVLLLGNLGGGSFDVNLGFSTEANSNMIRKVKSHSRSVSRDYVVTLTFLIEKLSANAHAQIAVDTLDIVPVTR